MSFCSCSSACSGATNASVPEEEGRIQEASALQSLCTCRWNLGPLEPLEVQQHLWASFPTGVPAAVDLGTCKERAHGAPQGDMELDPAASHPVPRAGPWTGSPTAPGVPPGLPSPNAGLANELDGHGEYRPQAGLHSTGFCAPE